MVQYHSGNTAKLKIRTRNGSAENGPKTTADTLQ